MEFFDAALFLASAPAPAAGGAAQAGGQATGGMGAIFIQLAPFILIIVVFYFLLIRPQQQRMKRHREMVANLRKGDEVVTAGGLIGKVVRVYDTEVVVELAQGVRVKTIKSTITDVRTRPEPVRARDEDDLDDEDEDERDADRARS